MAAVLPAIDVIKDIISVGKYIYEAVQMVKTFKNRSKTLAKRVEVIYRPIKELQKDLEAEPDPDLHRILKDLRDCFQQIKAFLDKLSGMRDFKKLWTRKSVDSDFDGFNNQLTTRQQSLSLILQAKLKSQFTTGMKDQMSETFELHKILKTDLEDTRNDLAELLELGLETQEMVEELKQQIADLEANLKFNQNLDNMRMSHEAFCDKTILHEGTFGPIYRVNHKHENKLLIVKEITDSESKLTQKELLQEADKWKCLRFSQFIVQLYGYVVDAEARLCFVVEYMKHGSLRCVLENPTDHPLPWEPNKIRLRMARDCAQGVYAIHYGQSKPMLHRAITTTRFFVNEYYAVKISDNGMTKSLSKISQRKDKVQGDVEKDEMLYLAPEEASINGKISIKTEIYKLGVVFYEIASRKRPFQATEEEKGKTLDVAEKRQFIKSGKTEKPPTDIPEDFRELIEICRATRPGDRPDTGDVVTRLNKMCL
ncbi:mixed lineage kinase domain-like protein [Diadema antillarum]|uniref:mixed lineage kinase domain-like protein n=1 Tax=Diadema antillarum TaxID=105358 RepID=UPI003A85A47C